MQPLRSGLFMPLITTILRYPRECLPALWPGFMIAVFLSASPAHAISMTNTAAFTTNLLKPSGVAVTSDGGFWVANQGSCYQNSLSGCSVTAKLVYNDGSKTRTIGGFLGLSGVAVDSNGNAWVSDIGANKVFHVTKGGYIDVVLYDPNSIVIDGPLSVAVDSKDNVYVANRNDQTITVFNKYGTFLRYWKVKMNLFYLTIDSQDRIWYADAQNNTINCLQCGTSFAVKDKSAPRALTVDLDGNVWVANYTYSNVTVYTPYGKPLATVKLGVRYPTGVALDADGNLYISNFTTNTVTIYSAQ